MEHTGIRRKIDDLGRVVIPVGMRKALGIAAGDELEVALDGERIVIVKLADRCAFCDASEPLHRFRSRAVCRSCLGAMGALARELAGHTAAFPPR